MLDRLDAQPRLSRNQWKLINATTFGLTLEFLDYFLIGFVLVRRVFMITIVGTAALALTPDSPTAGRSRGGRPADAAAGHRRPRRPTCSATASSPWSGGLHRRLAQPVQPDPGAGQGVPGIETRNRTIEQINAELTRPGGDPPVTHTAATETAPNVQTVRAKAAQYNNWGTWGPDDQLGSLNYVTPDKIAAAARLARTGKVFSLALPLDDTGPQTGSFGRYNPLHHMLWDGGDIAAGAQDHLAEIRYTDDAAYIILQSSTQWDALAHIFHDGKMYNGFGTEQVTSRGAAKGDICNTKDKMIGRGVLLDVPRWKGKPWLEPGEAISDADLEATAAAHGVEVGEGDFVLVRTGQIAQRRSLGSWGDYSGGPAPGLGVSAADFFCPRKVATVSTDTWGTEVLPNETPDVFQPLHIIMLVNAGILLGEIWDLEALADDCAADGVYEFLLVAPPLTITGAVGTPVNPQAVK